MIKQIEKSEFRYKSILDDICGRIRNGEYLPDTKLESIAGLQEKYSAGRNTVLRVLDELAGLNLIEKKKGLGSIIRFNPVKNDIKKLKEIRKILVFINKDKKLSQGNSEILNGIVSKANEYAVNTNIEFRTDEKINSNYLLAPKEDEGIITIFTLPVDNHPVLQYLARGNSCRCVIVDGIFPGGGSILSDNNAGMAQIIKYLFENGHREIAFCGKFSSPGCYCNVNERCDAFVRETARIAMKGHVLDDTEFEKLLALVRKNRELTALLFPADFFALNAIRFFEENGLQVPDDISICGYDDFAHGDSLLERLTTLRTDFHKMGEAAVEMLMESNFSSQSMQYWQRIPGKLMVRNSVKRIK